MDNRDPIQRDDKKLIIGKRFPNSYGRNEKENKEKHSIGDALSCLPWNYSGDLNTDMRRKTRVGRCWRMELGWESCLASFSVLVETKENSPNGLKITKADVTFPNRFKKDPNYLWDLPKTRFSR